MNKNLTDITIIVDRSGSMETIRTDAEGGINTFIEDQKKLPGEANFSLLQFDTISDWVHSGVPIKDVPKYTLEPRGMTALLDAVGTVINATGERLGKMPEADRPGLVIIVIVTDGHENSSQEFSRETIKKMIEHQTNAYNWKFTYLGANQDAFAEAGAIGITKDAAVNYTPNNAFALYACASQTVGAMRNGVANGEEVDFTYTAADREALVKE